MVEEDGTHELEEEIIDGPGREEDEQDEEEGDVTVR